MNHDHTQTLLPAYVDGELGMIRRFLLGRHIARCPRCLAALEAMQAMRVALRTNLVVHRAPPGLAARIGAALPREAPPAPARRPLQWKPYGAALAGGLAGAALTLVVTQPPSRPDPLVADAVADHVRSLMADHLTDVPSEDRHTVKPWMSARLDLSPVVKDLKADGFPLVGGRLDYVAGRQAAALVYRRDRHVINLFAFISDDPADAPPRQDSRDGFNVIRWRMGGLTYVAVSDVEMAQLQQFARLVANG
jgi:anti-sigma factor RsiW